MIWIILNNSERRMFFQKCLKRRRYINSSKSRVLQLLQPLLCLNRTKKQPFAWCDDPNLTSSIVLLSQRYSIADLSLFSGAFNEFCSAELSSIVSQLARLVRVTRRSASYVQNWPLWSRCCSENSCKLLNFLPPRVFPGIPNLQAFKSITKLPLLFL